MNVDEKSTAILVGKGVADDRCCEEFLRKLGYLVLTEIEYESGITVAGVTQPMLIFISLDSASGEFLNLIHAFATTAPTAKLLVIDQSPCMDSIKKLLSCNIFDYFERHLTPEEIITVDQKIKECAHSGHEICIMATSTVFEGMVGTTPVMKDLFKNIIMYAKTDANIFLFGESGTGKEMVARAIHKHSRRKNYHFVPIDCTVLTESLMESELFGYEQGAFTGANKRKYGLLEYGNKGTCFFDEITEINTNLQAKFLRVLQEREIRRIGSQEPIGIDIRVISATNKDPELAREQGLIREDLYYRLRVVPIRAPALREKKEDIPILCKYFLDELKKKNTCRIEDFSTEVIEVMKNYSWPGNVRELQGLIELIGISVQNEIVQIKDLPDGYFSDKKPFNLNHYETKDYNTAKHELLEEFQTNYFKQLYTKNKGNISQIARDADLSRQAVYKIIKSLNLLD